MTSLDAVLGPLTALVSHLRWRVGMPEDGDLLAVDLAADANRLAEVVAASAEGRGSEDPQVLGSLWWQAYSYRVAGMTLAAWALTGTAPDPAAPGTGVGVARSRPSSLLVDPAAAVVTDLPALIERLFAGHLDRVAESLRARHSLGAQLFWGDTAAGIASAFGAVGTAEGAPPLRDRVDEVTAALPHEIPRLGTSTPGRWAFRRGTCCLWWKTTASNGALCEDCSLRPLPEGAVP
jgi:ferric iron reductase protein FhuF